MDRHLTPCLLNRLRSLYMKFTDHGSLDVPRHTSRLVIARRFEQLVKWTFRHVRLSEEHMSDAELCLIEKENEKGDEGTSKVNALTSHPL